MAINHLWTRIIVALALVTPSIQQLVVQTGFEGIYGTTGLTQILNVGPPGSIDDFFWQITTPFVFDFFGTDYGNGNNGGIWMSSNGYITFGGGSQQYLGLSPSSPGRGVFFAAADRAIYQLYAGTIPPLNGINRYLVHYYAEDLGVPTDQILVELIFYSNNYLQINYGTLVVPTNGVGLQAISNGISYTNTWSALSSSTSKAFSTDTSGTTWSIFDGYWTASSTATSDPHLVSATGESYDFVGEPGNTYSLFSTPQFQVAMQLAGDGPGTHFMTDIGLLFKGEEFLFGVTTMDEEFRADLEARLTRVGGALLEWHPWFARVALCPGHTVSITQKHTTDSWLMRADGSPYNYYDVEIVAPGCHDAYDGALGQTYKCKYADGEPFVWSRGQEESFRLPTLFTPSGSYSVEAACDVEPAVAEAAVAKLEDATEVHRVPDASPRPKLRGLMSGAGKPIEAQVQAKAIDLPTEESHNALPSQPLRRYRKRTGPRTAEAQVAN